MLPPSPAHSLLRGKLLTKAGRYGEAIQMLGSHDNHMTENDQSECRVVLGVAHLYARQLAEVVKVLGGAEQKGAGQMPRLFRELSHYMMGVANLCLGHSREGLAEVNRSLILNPESYRVSYDTHTLPLPHTHTHTHSHTHTLTHTHTHTLTHAKAFLTRAAQFAREGRFAKAILNCNEAITLSPSSCRAFLYRFV